MEHRTLGKTGLNVSVLGFGAAEIGSSDFDNSDRLLGAALDAGLNVIDTAECYGDSEEFLGRSIAHRRNDFHLFTKVGHTSGLDGEDWDPKMMRESINRSLKRLQTDTVDLIQLHSCTLGMLRQGDVINVLREARDAGKTRFIGFSGDGDNAEYAIESGVFDTLQASISIADQKLLSTYLHKAAQADMGIIAKRPIANVAWQNGDKPPANEYAQEYWKRMMALEFPWATPANLNESVSIALRFTLAQPGVTTAIVGSQNPERWAKNAALLDGGPLPQDQIDAIRRRWNEVATDEWVGQQ